MTSIPRTARYVVRNQAETAEDAESTGENHRIPQHAIFRFFPDLSCLTVSFSCGVVYSRVKRTPESEKRGRMYISSKRKIKKKMLVYVPGGIRTRYVFIPGTYISPFVLALKGGVNSNASSREKLFLRTAYIPFCSSTRRRCELPTLPAERGYS